MSTRGTGFAWASRLVKGEVDYIKTDTDDKFLKIIVSRPAERISRLQHELVD